MFRFYACSSWCLAVCLKDEWNLGRRGGESKMLQLRRTALRDGRVLYCYQLQTLDVSLNTGYLQERDE